MAGDNHLMLDLSSNNALPDLKVLWTNGYRVLSFKATEGTSYAWTQSVALAASWHALGGSVWWYHFARPGNAVGQAKFFLAHVTGHTKPGDRLVLDCEVTGVDGALATAFWNTVRLASPLPEEDYGSPYFLRDHGIRPDRGQGLWLADYAAKPTFIPTGWTHYDAWQFTSAAHVPGEAGGVDQSHLAVTAPPPVKPPVRPDTKPAFYTVKAGDTLDSIIARYPGLDRAGMRAMNPVAMGHPLTAGEHLKVRSGTSN